MKKKAVHTEVDFKTLTKMFKSSAGFINSCRS